MFYKSRLATAADYIQIQNIFSAVAESVLNKSMFSWTDFEISREMLLSSFYVASTQSNQISAFIGFREGDEISEIIALGTMPDFLKQGLMFALLSDFVQKNSINSKSVHLEVHAENKSAILLYEKCGFKVLRIRKSYYKDGADALVMHYQSTKP